MAGQGQAPARQALIKAGLPLSTGAVTLSKMCGSAMQAAIFAHDVSWLPAAPTWSSPAAWSR
jgi:acetyl-CoA C-acetyltransferase